MKKFILMLDLPFANKELSNGIIFTHFLPRENEAIQLEDDKNLTKIYFSYERKHLNNVSNDFIKRQKDIKNYKNIMTNALRFKIYKEINNNLYEMLSKQVLHERTKCFCIKLKAEILELYDRIFDFTRNVQGQYWVKQHKYPGDNFNHFFLSTDAVWIYKDQPMRLYLRNLSHDPLHINFDSDKEQRYISRKDWENLKLYIINNEGKAKTEQKLLANALEYLGKDNKMALIESVIALEHFIKKENCENLKKFIQGVEFNIIKKLIMKKNLFSIPMELFLDKISNKLKQNNISSEDILKSIEIRNSIMHNSQKDVIYWEAKKLVLNIEKFIRYLKQEKKSGISAGTSRNRRK